jgi:hypothetical protein
MRTQIFCLAAVAAVGSGLTASAQLQNASQQVDSLQQRRQLEQAAQLMVVTNGVPELFVGESSDVGPQSVLKLKSRRTLIEASADVQYFYSDNMFLANSGKQDVDVLVTTVQAALAPTPYEFHGGLLAPRLGYQHQWFAYDLVGEHTVNAFDSTTLNFNDISLKKFDFNVSTIFSDVSWTRNNWTFTFGGDFRRMLDSGTYDEFYKELVPRWAIRRDFILNEKQALSLGYEGDYRVSETPNVPPTAGSDFNDRTDHSLVVVGSWRLCQHAILQPSYRFQYTHYTATRRDDFLQSFGLAVYCPLNDNVSLRGFVSYDSLATDGFYANNYEKLDAGIGLNLTVRF